MNKSKTAGRKRKAALKAKGEVKSVRAQPTHHPSDDALALSQQAPPIVGIGASAGGLDAFRELLGALSSNTGMAFVLVQHLEPTHESMLTKLLAGVTKMPVQQVRDGMRVEPNHVYIIPANADLNLMDGLLHVVGRRAPAGRHLPIDYFFRSLAETRKSQAIGVILSGTASDGTAGLKAIKAEGGVTLAQEPSSAKFDGMPRSAIHAGCVDLVLPPKRIATELIRIARHPLVSILPAEGTETLTATEKDWPLLFRMLRTGCAVDFSLYKRSMVARRIARRMAVNKLESLTDYIKFLEGNRPELASLFQDILIHVTNFFRDPEVFVALKEQIFPQILVGRPPGEPVRIWVPGCSTGEEVYSTVICLLECLGDRAADTPLQVFATDINEAAIEKARSGVYSEQELEGVSIERRDRFFSRVNGSYTVRQNIREYCVFARHDLTKDPPFSRLDLLSCRNVLIYFEPALQKRALASFHYALKPSGMLLLGRSESVGAFAGLFIVTDRKNKFFTKNAAVDGTPLEVARAPYERPGPFEKSRTEAPMRVDLEKEADRIVWDRYAHAGIVVNNELQILHFRGDSSRYLQPAPGKATFNLSRMLREELQLELRAAFQEARKSGHSVRRDGIPLRHEQRRRLVNLEVCPLPASGEAQKSFLILFDETASRAAQPSRRSPGKRSGKSVPAGEVEELENELARARDHLQAVIREHEYANEELKTANEEALSSMEELQSTNEELETAKEELQSSNEELVTLNEQLQNRNSELMHLSDDLSNVISGVDIPMVILDADRRIRRLTPPAQRLLGILPGDVGRPIGNLRLHVNIPDLDNLTSRIIAQAGEVECEVQSEDGGWYWLRVRPFRTAEQKIDGVVIALFDIQELKQNQEALRNERNFISAILDAAKDLLVVVLNREGRIVQFNRVCQQLSGYSVEEVKDRRPWDFLVPRDEAAAVEKSFNEVLAGTPNQIENHWVTRDGRRLLIGWSNSPAMVDSAVGSVIASGIDHTQRAEAQQRVQESEATVRALLETAAQAILAIDQQGRIVLANATTESMFGYGRKVLIGQPMDKLMPQRFRQQHAGHMAKWFLRPSIRQMGIGLELAGLRKDGTEFPIDVSLSYTRAGDRILGVAFVSDVTERKRNEAALLDYQKQLQRLTGYLLRVQETANRELARELHDVFSQELAALRMEVSTLLSSTEAAEPLTERLADLGRKIGNLADEMHRTSRQLHPQILHDLGLEAALREECDRFSEQFVPVRFTCEGDLASLPEDVSLCLYRVAQESLLNIRKHTGATRVRVRLWREGGGVNLLVEDTGDGFNVDEARKGGGLGLTSMEERVRLVNGKFNIRSQSGAGTTVEVFVPLNESAG